MGNIVKAFMTTIIHLSASSIVVPSSDRSFNYGDGCFTTILCRNWQLYTLDAHIGRLQRATRRLAFAPVDWTQLRHQLIALAKTHSDHSQAVVKVLISRGSGGRGYTPDDLQPTIYISQASYPLMYDDWRRSGITLGLSPVKLGLNPLLAGIKHCNRLEQVLIKQALQNQPWQDAVVCDLNDTMVGCTASNLFWQTDGQWFTPLIDTAGVDGVMKQTIMAQLAPLQQCHQVKHGIASLLQADSVFICNALMGIIPVRQFDDGWRQQHYDLRISGQLATSQQQLMRNLTDG
jgi:4-amino-4-deoxychorismate lyase